MATAPKPARPASAPDATKTSIWGKMFGGGQTDAAAKSISGRQTQLDAEERKATGYKDGGMVKCTKSSTKRNWG